MAGGLPCHRWLEDERQEDGISGANDQLLSIAISISTFLLRLHSSSTELAYHPIRQVIAKNKLP